MGSEPIFDPQFSDSSYGFRPGRCSQDAVRASRGYVESGDRFVVNLDPEKFLDRVNHDVLMARVARRVKDKRLLRLLRRYLESLESWREESSRNVRKEHRKEGLVGLIIKKKGEIFLSPFDHP